MPRATPFDQVHRQLGAQFDTFDDWSLPADFGDTTTETDALNRHCVVVDLCSFGRLQVRGSQVKDALERIFSEKSGSINTDSWVWAKTKTLDQEDTLCRIVRTNGDFLLLTQPAETNAVCEKLNSDCGKDIEAIDVTHKTAMLGLYGPEAFSSMRSVLPFDIEYLDQGDAAKMSLMMLPFTLLRGSWLAGDGLELICPASAGPLAAGAVAKYRHKYNITPAGMTCLQNALANTKPPL
jgi:glycine cleavage system aminomethyltransferase T